MPTSIERPHWAPYPSALEEGRLPHAEVRIQNSPDTAGERVQPGPRDRRSECTPELVERRSMFVLGGPQSQRRRLGEHHRRSDMHMDRLTPLQRN